MSTINSKNVQVGTSGVANQNFTLYQPNTPDGTVRLGIGNSGVTTGDVLTVNSSGLTVSGALSATTGTFSGAVQASGVATNLYPLVSGTAVVSTSGTSIDFTSIPSWVKRVTVMFNGVSLSATSNYLIQIGAGSVTSSGYVSACNNGAGTVTTSTSGFLATVSASAADLTYGNIVLTTPGSNVWTQMSILNNGSAIRSGAGAVTLGGTLDRVRITTVNGTDTFDAGSINILYE
jgi:hypothetical protein